MSDEIKIHCSFDQMVDVRELKEHPRNNNKHTKEQLARLVKVIKANGFRRVITVSRNSGFMTAGHLRLLAAKELGMKQVPVNFQHYDNEDLEYADLTADNALQEWSEIDMAMINSEIGTFDPSFDIDLLGIKGFTLDVFEKEFLEDEDSIPEVVEPTSKLGDIYQLGEHRVMCGDSTMIDNLDKLLNGNVVDLVFTDPPYNQETKGSSKSEIVELIKKQSSEIEFMCNFDPSSFLSVLPTVFKKNTINAIIFCNKDLVFEYLKFGRDFNYYLNILFWKKPNAIPLNSTYRSDVEYIISFTNNGIFNFGLFECEYSKCLEFSREKNKVHPTMKPVEMIENQIKIRSNKNGNVLDFFGGSGSTLIACEKTNRRCFMIELDPKYVDVILKRWEDFTGKKAVLLNG